MKDDKTRGYVMLVAIGLLWFTLATKTLDTWQWPDIVIMTVAASLLTPIVLEPGVTISKNAVVIVGTNPNKVWYY